MESLNTRLTIRTPLTLGGRIPMAAYDMLRYLAETEGVVVVDAEIDARSDYYIIEARAGKRAAAEVFSECQDKKYLAHFVVEDETVTFRTSAWTDECDWGRCEGC